MGQLSPCFITTEPSPERPCSTPQWEARASQLNSSPHVLQLEKALHAAMKTHPQPKIKTKTSRKPQNFPCLLVHNYIVLSSIRFFATLWTVARQASPSIGFSRQEYWSRLPCPPFRGSSWPRNQTRVSCISCTAGGFFTTKSSGKPITISVFLKNTQTKTKKSQWLPWQSSSQDPSQQMQGSWVQSLVRELDPTCHIWKIQHVKTKTQHSQINYI